MDTFEVPGLDIAELLKPRETTAPSQDTSTTQGGVFPIRDSFEVQIPDSSQEIDPSTGKPKAEKKPLNFEKPTIAVRGEEVATTDTAADTQVSPIKAVAEFLKSKGTIEYTEEEFKDEDDFIAEQYTKSVAKANEAYKDSIPAEIKSLINLYEEGVPIGALLEKEREIFEYSQVKPEGLKDNKELQKTLVHNFYAEMGWEAGEITEKLQELEDSGVLEKESTRALTKLTNLQLQQKQDLIATAQRNKAEKEVKYKEQVSRLQEQLKTTKEFFPGIALTEIDKKAVFEGITKFNGGKNKVMEFLDKPENYMLVSYIANALKGDFSKLKKTATTQAINGIKETIAATPAKSAFSGINTSIIKNALKL